MGLYDVLYCIFIDDLIGFCIEECLIGSCVVGRNVVFLGIICLEGCCIFIIIGCWLDVCCLDDCC